MQQPLIFDIKRYSINDGPGIRLTIFFKGCPLNCRWCHNPESISPKVQKLFTASKCIRCGECCRVCPTQACALTADGIFTNEALCTLCGKCAEVCPTLATEMSGRYRSVDELMAIIDKERLFFDQSVLGVRFLCADVHGARCIVSQNAHFRLACAIGRNFLSLAVVGICGESVNFAIDSGAACALDSQCTPNWRQPRK